MRLSALAVLAAALGLTAGPARAAPATTPAPASAVVPASVASALPAALDITPFRMHYRVLRDGWHLGNATFTLQRSGPDGWVFESMASASGLASLFVHSNFSEKSRFVVHDHLLRPLSYAYTDSGNPSHDEDIRFDWAAGTAYDKKDGKTRQVGIRAGMLDRLSAQLSLSRRLSAGRPLPNTIYVVKDGKLKRYHFTRRGKDMLATPAGDFSAVIVAREDPDSRRTTVFWLAPRYQWLPVKMQQREPGKPTITFVLYKLTWLKP